MLLPKSKNTIQRNATENILILNSIYNIIWKIVAICYQKATGSEINHKPKQKIESSIFYYTNDKYPRQC